MDAHHKSKSRFLYTPWGWTLDDHHFADYILKCISLNEKFCILYEISQMPNQQ